MGRRCLGTTATFRLRLLRRDDDPKLASSPPPSQGRPRRERGAPRPRHNKGGCCRRARTFRACFPAAFLGIALLLLRRRRAGGDDARRPDGLKGRPSVRRSLGHLPPLSAFSLLCVASFLRACSRVAVVVVCEKEGGARIPFLRASCSPFSLRLVSVGCRSLRE